MKLSFTSEEQLHIHYLVKCIIEADRLVLLEENVCWNTISLKMGWGIVDIDTLAGCELQTSIQALAQMDEDKKRFATAFFTMIILADRHIAPEEVDLFTEIASKANLPKIATADCPEVLDNYTK